MNIPADHFCYADFTGLIQSRKPTEVELRIMGKKVRYSSSLITYLDILGFRNLIECKTAGEISRVLRILKETTKPDEEVAKAYEMQFFNFSDTTVRITPLDTPSNIKYRSGYLFGEILSLVYVQYELILQGVIVRGAVSVGDIVKSWGIFYGPGLVRAYDLERKASDPRIIIDDLLFAELRRNPVLRAHDYKEELKYIRTLIRKDTDGLWFIDYLGAVQTDMEYPEENYPRFLRRHAGLISEGLVRHRLEKKILPKFRWLQRYHNDTIDLKFGKGLQKELRV